MRSAQPLASVKKKDFLSVLDFGPADLERCIHLAAQLKRERKLTRSRGTDGPLSGMHVALLFDKPSLRTRSTFEIAVRELGGAPVTLPPDVALGSREPAADVARNLERWVDAAVIRTSSHAMMAEFALAAPRLHVINALTDEEHPCQALADFLTLREHWGNWHGRTLAFVGDGNNVATSLAHASCMAGINVHVATPDGYALPRGVIEEATQLAQGGATIRTFDDPREAVDGVDAIYTDVWASMGEEDEAVARRLVFAPYQVNRELMSLAAPDAMFMHCLPAHRGDEVTAEVMESPASVIFEQAENRLHTQKALLLMLLA